MNPNAKEYYNKINEGYENKWTDLDAPKTASQFYRQRLNELALEMADVRAGEKAIEIGCGTGLVLSELIKKTDRVYGLDISSGMLERAQNRLRQFCQVEIVADFSSASKPFDNRVLLKIGDFKNLELPKNYFDKVFSIEVLRYVDDIVVGLKNVATTMAPNGVYVFTLTNVRSAGLFPIKYLIRKLFGLVKPDELQQYFVTEKSLRRKINESGLEIIDFKRYGFLTVNGWSRKLIKARARFEKMCHYDSKLAKVFPFNLFFDTFIVKVSKK